MRRTRVYIAGPISKGDLQSNIDRGTIAATELLRAGFAPLCPMLTCYMDGVPPSALAGVDEEVWYDSDLPWVAVSDCVLRLPGASVGADKETDLAETLGIPVYYDLGRLVNAEPATRFGDTEGNPAFLRVLREMASLHAMKAADYGSGDDPLANVRATEGFGVAPWLGALLRANDKVHRLKEFAKKGTLANEGVEDSLIDLAAYAIISLVLFREGK
jgi:hypothetical protein